MTEINDLRERVEAAEQRFGLMDEQQRHYSERLIGLIGTIEAQLAAARSEIEKQIDENLRLGQENEELRSMLHSILRSIEEKTFTRTLQNLEARVSALVANGGAAAAVAAEPATAAPAGPAAADDLSIEAPDEPSGAADAIVDAGDPESSDEGQALIFEAPEDATTAAEEPAAELPLETSAVDQATGEEAAGEGPVDDGLAETEATAATGAEATEAADEGAEDLFGAMTELNASDEAFAEAVAEAPEPAAADAEASSKDAEPAMEDMGEAASGMAEAADDASEQAAQAEATATVTTDDSAAPTVKEIIRRVGDLARELERAESVRRASRAGEETGDPAAEMLDPPLDRAANA